MLTVFSLKCIKSSDVIYGQKKITIKYKVRQSFEAFF